MRKRGRGFRNKLKRAKGKGKESGRDCGGEVKVKERKKVCIQVKL